jgi:hypothetical protein
MNVNNALSAAIAGLYRTFQGYRLGDDFEGCSHCVSETEDLSLKGKGLTELTCDDIRRYAFKAMTTWGTVEDFKHFLPRIFELAATSEDFPLDLEVAVGKLSYGKWRSWPEREQSAIELFLNAWWENALSRPLSDSTQCLAGDVLCSLAQVFDDIDSHLAHWDSRTDIEAALHLAAFIDWNFYSLYKKDRLGSAFWENEYTMRQAIALLKRPATRERLEWHFLMNSDGPHAYLLSEAAEKLGWWISKQS